MEVRLNCKVKNRLNQEPPLCAWMGLFINIQQMIGIDPGIDLRGRKRGMTEQLLNGAQIAAIAQ